MLRSEEAQQVGHQGDVEDGDDADMERAAQLSRFATDFLEEIL
jgi:hypothetical protein